MWGHAHDEYASRTATKPKPIPSSSKTKRSHNKSSTSSSLPRHRLTDKDKEAEDKTKGPSPSPSPPNSGNFKYRGKKKAAKKTPIKPWGHAHDEYAKPRSKNKPPSPKKSASRSKSHGSDDDEPESGTLRRKSHNTLRGSKKKKKTAAPIKPWGHAHDEYASRSTYRSNQHTASSMTSSRRTHTNGKHHASNSNHSQNDKDEDRFERMIEKLKESRASEEEEDEQADKSGKELMELFCGMHEIKQAEKYQALKKWKDCVECYDEGIGELEKSLKAVKSAEIYTEDEQHRCQQQIDEYCRILITTQREHKQEITAADNARKRHSNPNIAGIRRKNTKKQPHVRSGTHVPQKKNKKHNSTSSEFRRHGSEPLTPQDLDELKDEISNMKLEQNDDEENNSDELKHRNDNDENDQQNPPKSRHRKRSSADFEMHLKKPESDKKYKKRMSTGSLRKKKTKPAKKVAKIEEQPPKKKKDKKKKKKKKKHADDDEKEDNKKKSGVAKQDAEFRSRLEADIISEAPDVCFKDVQGLANVKLALYETIILPAMRPELFTGLRTPTGGLLLFGPPGNGKTMIAKCVAAECEATFFSISASSITSKFVGDAERIMRTLFNLAREKAPSIIFIDEIDSMLTARGGKNEAESSRRIKTEFLIQFDGVKKASDSAKRILVIGATNLPDQLDEAVLRRFGKRIMVPLPDPETRSGLLRLLMSKQKADLSEEDYQEIITKTDGYSCSDLSTLCKDAAMGPIRSLGARILEIKNMADMPPIKKTHFDGALDNVRPSLTTESLKFFDDWNDKYGSKIHLSMSALPESMRPYTMEELAEIARKRAEAEEKEKAAAEEDEAESSSGEYEDDSEEESDD